MLLNTLFLPPVAGALCHPSGISSWSLWMVARCANCSQLYMVAKVRTSQAEKPSASGYWFATLAPIFIALPGPRISAGYVAELLHQALYALRHLHHDTWAWSWQAWHSREWLATRISPSIITLFRICMAMIRYNRPDSCFFTLSSITLNPKSSMYT